VVSSRRPAPGPITNMTAEVGSTAGVVLRRVPATAQDTWQAAVDIDATGSLTLRIVAGRNHPGPVTLAATWVVPSGVAARPVVVSNRPLAPWTAAAAGILAVLAMAAGSVLVSRHRRTPEAAENDCYQQLVR